MRSIVRGLVLLGMAAGAAPAAFAQVPRGTAEARIGNAKLAIEYGAPPWNAARQQQLDTALPVGEAWRLGADGRTTLLIDGGDVLIGGVLVEAGGYGLNLRRTGEQEWAFVAYDGSDTNVADGDGQWEIPAKRVESKEASAQLEVLIRESNAGAAGAAVKALVVRFGPIELSAPLDVVVTEEGELSIAGESATVRSFMYLPESLASDRFVRVGRVGSFFVGDDDGAFDVDLRRDGAKALLRFSSRGRAAVADRVARQRASVERLKARAGAAASPRVRQGIERAESELAKLEAELVALATLPPPYEVAVPLKQDFANATGTVTVRLRRRNDALWAEVFADDSTGAMKLDEAKLLPKGGSQPR